ncbi:unnamed protein product [Owenia fusiformis]|uniref:Gamma-aminobutyric acid receptor subunit beta n=1 Tax=Owenia fusiformis TaxID=6347 RepID=A0A8J1TI09_OWEFU|nr:unnamed protein product [Owenia fusiformis]
MMELWGLQTSVMYISAICCAVVAGFDCCADGEYSDKNTANVSRSLDNLLKGYDKRLRPFYKQRGKPAMIGITMFVSAISSISEIDMSYTVDFYFRQFWTDPRLAFELDVDELCISNDMIEKIWRPDTFFANAKTSSFHDITNKNAFFRIKPSGDILLSLRLTVVAACNMDLRFFPMDTQLCTLEIESFGYKTVDIMYEWLDGPINSMGMSKAMALPQFTIYGYRLVERLEVLSTGNYSRLALEMLFVRSMGYYLIQIYVPSTLIVVLSWVSFWLSREAVPARVALGITTVLTMTTLISSTNAALPKISYLKSIDVYLVTCFLMVFTSLLEYAAVSYIGKQCQRKAKMELKDMFELGMPLIGNGLAYPATREQNLNDNQWFNAERKGKDKDSYTKRRTDSTDSSSSTDKDETDQQCGGTGRKNKPSDIDKFARVFFPSMFVVFSVIYWVTYLNISHSGIDNSFTRLQPPT